MSKISFNPSVVRGMTLAEFTAEFEPHFPKLDLKKEYEKIVPPKSKKTDDK